MEGRWINTTAELSDRCAGKKKENRNQERQHTEPEKRGDTRVSALDASYEAADAGGAAIQPRTDL